MYQHPLEFGNGVGARVQGRDLENLGKQGWAPGPLVHTSTALDTHAAHVSKWRLAGRNTAKLWVKYEHKPRK